MSTKALIKKAIKEAIFLLNDELESVIDKEIAARYELVLNDLQKALNLLHKLSQERHKWTNSLN